MVHAKYLLRVAQNKQTPVTFVIGNESAGMLISRRGCDTLTDLSKDLDSISSAIVYSYIATISPQSRKPAVFHVPVINIPKADVSLRPELIALLPKANINREHLITLDDLGDPSTYEERLPPEQTRWILVDHNALQGKLGELYSSRVVGTIDHHEDEGKVPQDVEGEPRTITTCGSCSSLIINHFRNQWDSWFLTVSFSGAANGQGDNLIEDGAFATLWDAQVAHMSLAAVLVDTANLKDDNKTTEQDRQAVEYLETKIKMSLKLGKDYDRDNFFDAMQKAKEDLGPLSIRDILRKDYKEWRDGDVVLGTSAVVRPFAFLSKKADEEGKGDMIDHCKAFAEQRGLSVVSVMTAYTDEDGSFARQLLVVGGSEKGRKVIEQFRQTSVDDLDLQQLEQGDDQGWLHFIWQQRNLAASRKQVAPLLRQAMSSA